MNVMKYKNRNMARLAGRMLLMGTLLATAVSCDDFLNREPISKPTPEQYFTSVDGLAAYVDDKYPYWLPNHGYDNETGYQYGIFKKDAGTDNQVSRKAPDNFIGNVLVPSDRGGWDFWNIYQCNWFFEQVEDRLMNGEVSGDQALGKHYLGEMYFLRAYLYFDKLQSFGDFPIVDHVLADNTDTLLLYSQRKPRNEVARFILSDLQKAADLMKGVEVATTRISEDVAYLMMSRVALYEATWLKYFKNTPFVPLGTGWPGFDKEYSKSYQYPLGGIDAEIEYFLDKALEAADLVASEYMSALAENTGKVLQTESEKNPYLEMFGSVDLSVYPEVMLWMQYGEKLTTHGAVVYAQEGNNGVGLTRGLVDNFLMTNGLPIYAENSGYLGDSTFRAVRTDRDLRLFTFLQEPGQINYFDNSTQGGAGNQYVAVPRIDQTTTKQASCTGYAMRKGNSTDRAQSVANGSWTGCVVFRSAEALLNYIEASIEKNNGQLSDSKARTYWEALRKRSGITAAIEVTVDATVMAEEAKNDWGAYSAGELLESKYLYNIRRERRCEFIGDGLRMMDLKRWRAMDQMTQDNPYHIEGIHIYDPVMEKYLKDNGVTYQNRKGEMSVSPEEDGEYFKIYRIAGNTSLPGYSGFFWRMAHYLNPIGAQEFLYTATDGATKETSPIYQNPYWTLEANSLPTK